MSNVPVTPEVISPQLSPSQSSLLRKHQFDLTLARPFIYKSVSEETRAAYTRAIREFFNFVGDLHPSEITPAHVINYRDHLSSTLSILETGNVNKRLSVQTIRQTF